MIIVQIIGGLGNQFFQYAAGKALAEENGTNLFLDTNLYKKAKRPYVLDQFNITAKKASVWDVVRLKYFSFGHRFIEPGFEFYADFFNIGKDSYIEGLFQKEKYFKKISNIIREEFSLKIPVTETNPEMAKQIKESHSVSVSIRRGDYLGKSHVYNILTPEYYEKAMKQIKEKVDNPKFFFFSDDIAWVKENIVHPAGSVFVSDGVLSGPVELELMTLCKHNIIANSTFSWWGAWLNQNPEKIIISPEKWFADTSKNTHDLLPEEWLKI